MSQLRIPRLIGHRGAKASAPENTLAGIRQARREGATWVEFDVKLTADGHPILMHDDTLDRTTDGHGPVVAAALEDIRRLDAGIRFAPAFRGERIPTLTEALDVLAELDMGFNLEIKPCAGRERETAQAAVDIVQRHWSAARPLPVISSFKQACLIAARDQAPDLPRGYLVDELPERWADEVQRLGCSAVHVGWRKLTKAQVAAVKVAGFPLLVWTVNEPARARELLGWGADAVISDCPAALTGL
jgi:glycerophosphoryl diester phosphodiesterase